MAFLHQCTRRKRLIQTLFIRSSTSSSNFLQFFFATLLLFLCLKHTVNSNFTNFKGKPCRRMTLN